MNISLEKTKVTATTDGFDFLGWHFKVQSISLWHLNNRTWKVFNQEANLNPYQVNELVHKAFPKVTYSENKFVNVKGEKSPYDGDLVYWSKRNSALYDEATAKALFRQSHSCGDCGLMFMEGEKVHLHHVDGNHQNWKRENLLAIHQSCHDYVHMSKRESSPN